MQDDYSHCEALVREADLPAYDVPEAALDVVKEGLRRVRGQARLSSDTSRPDG